jgi:phage-related protein
VKQEREIIFHGRHFIEFYVEQTTKVQEKIEFVFKVIRTVNSVPEKFLKHLVGTDGLYEIRIEVEGNIFRIFCCFDKGNLVVLFNAFQKKTQKTPKQELDLAKKLKKEYFKLKEQENEKGTKKR